MLKSVDSSGKGSIVGGAGTGAGVGGAWRAREAGLREKSTSWPG